MSREELRQLLSVILAHDWAWTGLKLKFVVPGWFYRSLLLLVASCLAPLTAADPIVAKNELDRVKALVNAGALPRNALAKAQDDLDKAKRQETIRKTLLNTDLTEAQIPEMLRAVTAVRDSVRAKLDASLRLVEEGALPVNQLKELREDTEFAEKQYELAQSRAKIVKEMAAMARAEQRFKELEEEELAYYSEGSVTFWERDLPSIDAIFFQQFGVGLPVSAQGATEVHRSMGFDHRDRVDVAVHPDDDEGFFLISLLETWGIPYIAFKSAVPGQSTGAHVHIGPRSERIPLE